MVCPYVKIDIGEDRANVRTLFLGHRQVWVFFQRSAVLLSTGIILKNVLESCPVLDFVRVTIDYSSSDTWAKKVGCQVLRSGPGPGGASLGWLPRWWTQSKASGS